MQTVSSAASNGIRLRQMGKRPLLHRGWLALTLIPLSVLYLVTLPEAHTISDSYEWIACIRSGRASSLFHPHHLVYNALAWIWSRPFVALGTDLWTAVQLLKIGRAHV